MGTNSNDPNATCRLNCLPARCGDNILDTDTEVCDFGDNVACDGCSADCSREDNDCGDGIPECGEACDLGDPPSGGNSNDADAACRIGTCVPATCGDGITDPGLGEDCDGSVPAGEDCTDRGFYFGTLACGENCRWDVRDCDGVCGDGHADTGYGEECDGGDLDSTGCLDRTSPNGTDNYRGGTLGCLPDCTFTEALCTGWCGDGIKNGPETCDLADIGTATCESVHNRYVGLPGCNAACDDFTMGTCEQYCGDGIKNGPELCDGEETGSVNCGNFGYYTGDLDCDPSSNCQAYDFDASSDPCEGYCGDGVKDAQEQCDGPDFGGEFCNDINSFPGGGYGCNHYCQQTRDKCYAEGWQRKYADPPTLNYKAVWVNHPWDVWAVAYDGTVMRYNGSWYEMPLQPALGFHNGVWGASGDDVWVCSTGGRLHHWDGTSWTMTTLTGGPTLYAIHGVGSDDIYAVASGAIYHYSSSTWLPETLPAGVTETLATVYATSSSNVWAAGASGRILRKNSGAWQIYQPNGTNYWYGIWGTHSTNMYVVGNVGQIRHFDGDWNQSVVSGTTGPLRAIWGTSDDDYWVVGDDGYLAHHDGNSLSRITLNSQWDLDAVHGSSTADVVAVGNQGHLQHFNGRNWFPLSGVPSGYITDVLTYGTNIRTVGNGGVILQCTGDTCTTATSPTSNNLRAINGTSVGAFVVVGDNGTVWTYSARFGWSDKSITTTNELNDVWGPSWDFWVVGTGGRISHYDGAWTHTPYGTATWMAVWGSPDDELFVAGANGAVRYRSAMGIWSSIDLPSTSLIYSIWGTTGSDVYAVTGLGIWHYDGSSWAQMDTGPTSMSFNDIWGDASDNLFAVGTTGKVWHWDGSAWSPMLSNTTVTLQSVRGDDSVVYTVGTDTVHQLNATMPRPFGGECFRPMDIYCGMTLKGSNLNMPDRMDGYPLCGGGAGGTGGESIYKLENTTTGIITVRVTAADGDLDLIVLGADSDGGCNTGDCVGMHDTGTGTPAEVTINPAQQGETFYFVIENTGVTSGYTIEVDCDRTNQ